MERCGGGDGCRGKDSVGGGDGCVWNICESVKDLGPHALLVGCDVWCVCWSRVFIVDVGVSSGLTVGSCATALSVVVQSPVTLQVCIYIAVP